MRSWELQGSEKNVMLKQKSLISTFMSTFKVFKNKELVAASGHVQQQETVGE